ncbi:hypothetical protein XENOCAPTIV_000220, partial [Xenoophorus captivus]
FVQFFLRLGCGKAAPDPRSQPVLLQFSVVVGGSASGWGPLEDDFSAIDGRSWLLHPGGTRMPNVGSLLQHVFSKTTVRYSIFSLQSCTRQLVTVDLNLTNAEFIQFYFMYGCMIPPSNRNQGVLLEYSLNGGINWHLLTEIFYDMYTKPG